MPHEGRSNPYAYSHQPLMRDRISDSAFSVAVCLVQRRNASFNGSRRRTGAAFLRSSPGRGIWVCRRKRKAERRSGAGLARHLNLPAVRLEDASRNEQAEAGPLARASAPAPVALENIGDVLGRNDGADV